MTTPSTRFQLPGRIREWGAYLLPFLLGVGYVMIFCLEVEFLKALSISGLFLVTISATAAFGYLLNDITDLKEDRMSGKSNLVDRTGARLSILFLVLFFVMALLPWIFLPRSMFNLSFYAFQFLMLAIYSVPPLRLKRLALPGIINDALYNSVVPVFIIITTFLAYARKDPFPLVLPLTVVFIWSFLKGTRNILLHQLSDRRNDRISGLRTFVIRYGPLGTVNLLNRIFIPLESFFLTVLVIGISFYISGFYLVFIGFLIFSMLKIRIWSISWMPRRQWRFLFWYSLNDFYEEWIPVSFLVWLSVRDPLFLILLAAHLLLFPRVFYKMAKELKEMNHDWLIYYERNVGQVILEQTWKAMVFLGTSFAWPFQWFYWHALRPFWLYIFRTPIRLRRFFIQINRKWFGGNLIVYFSLIRGHFTGRPMDEEGWGKLETRRFVIRDTDISEVVPEELDRMIRRARAVQFISEEDPFRVEAFYPLWEYMIRIKRSCLIEVSTSALELDERARHIIGKGLFRITVPLETLKKERFEKLHPESDHERFMEHLAFLESYSRKENIPLHLQITLTRDNWKEWPDMVDFCSRMRAFVRFGGDTGSQGNPSLAFTDHETGRIRDFLKQNLPVGKGLFAGINRKEYQRFINNL